jgi:hypothetical protein
MKVLTNHIEINNQEIFFNKEKSVFSAFADFKLHSQTVIIFQPSFLNAFTAFISLALLVFILFSHQVVLVFGTTKYLQLLCPCQKQPWIKMMVLYFGNTISGLPGNVFLCQVWCCRFVSATYCKNGFSYRVHQPSGKVTSPISLKFVVTL